jgi:hypothetical protein
VVPQNESDVPHRRSKEAAKCRLSALCAVAQKVAKHEAVDLMNDSEDDSRFDPHDLPNDDFDDERKPAAKKYNTGLEEGYNTGGAVNSEDDEKDEDYKGSHDESVDDNAVGDDNGGDDDSDYTNYLLHQPFTTPTVPK